MDKLKMRLYKNRRVLFYVLLMGVVLFPMVYTIFYSLTKAGDFFPDHRHFMSLNHETNSMTIFRINYEEKYFSMWGRPIKVETPNCILVSEIQG